MGKFKAAGGYRPLLASLRWLAQSGGGFPAAQEIFLSAPWESPDFIGFSGATAKNRALNAKSQNTMPKKQNNDSKHEASECQVGKMENEHKLESATVGLLEPSDAPSPFFPHPFRTVGGLFFGGHHLCL